MTAPYNAASLVPARAERDGCDCPFFVTRCVHVDRMVICLCVDSPVAHCCGKNSRAAFAVLSRNKLMPCPETGALTHIFLHERYYAGDSEADALAAFYAAEQALVERGDA